MGLLQSKLYGWPNKASVTSPPQICTQDGVTAINSNTQSVCDGGSSYICTDQKPCSANNSFSYGYAGASLIVSSVYFQ